MSRTIDPQRTSDEREYRGVTGGAMPQLLITAGVVILIAVALYAKGALTTAPAAAAPAANHYVPRQVSMTVTIVPQWVHEETGTFDYLGAEFSKKALLAGKEVWGFSPNTITAYQGDTLDITLYNPSSDPHTFTVTGLPVNQGIAGTASTRITFTASKVGIFPFACDVAEHDPFMWGQIVVLPASDGPQS